MEVFPGQYVWWNNQKALVVSVVGNMITIRMPDGTVTVITKDCVVLA